MQKIGMNDRQDKPTKSPVSFVIIDNQPHLKASGINYLCDWASHLFLVTTNPHHVAFALEEQRDNLTVLAYDNLNLKHLLRDLKVFYNIDRLTVQSGGSLNGEFLRQNLFDAIHLVVAPLISRRQGNSNTH